MDEAAANPVLIEVTRGKRIESVHRGAAAVIGRDGALVASWGGIDRPTFVRSAAKPLQALALVESGAVDRFGVSSAELAIACGSHSGEPAHVGCVGDWLARLGLLSGDLVCGAHPPTNAAAARLLIRTGTAETALHNNCSGKHAGFLTAARHLNQPLASYGAVDHPLQVRVRQIISEMSDVEIDDAMCAIDGCSAPIFALPVRALALAYARLADPSGLPSERAAAIRRITAAMVAHPLMVAGHGRFDSELMAAAAGAIIVKGGAEGVYAAALPSLGLGIALKIDDGAKRGAEVAMAALLHHFAEPEASARQWLADRRRRPLHNCAGTRVGEVRPRPGWLGA